MELLQRAKESGRVIPSLVAVEDGAIEVDGFGADLLGLLDGAGFHLAPDKATGDAFVTLMKKKAESLGQVPESVGDEATRKRALVLRRSMLLAVAGGTPPDSPSLSQALSGGYLNSVKKWLEDVLVGSVGSVDLLLHLLSNIVQLPVTKTVVKTSGMGKAIGQIEKHPICVGTANESAISERVQQVKDAWNASVKLRKSQDAPPPVPAPAAVPAPAPAPASAQAPSPSVAPAPVVTSNSVNKRVAVGDAPSPAASAKKIKTTASSFSTLLKKVSGSNSSSVAKPHSAEAATPTKTAKAKGASKYVKWADHFGGQLSASQVIDGDVASTAPANGDSSVSWSDRKKRDRLREKELLSKVKKSKLMDDDEEEDSRAKQSIPIQLPWLAPALLPDLPDVTKPQLSSSEVASLNERMAAILKAVYRSEFEVPSSPAPLTDVEQALDMTSQASSVVQSIPFFAPPVAAPVSDVAYAPPQSAVLPQVSAASYALPPSQLHLGGQLSGATPEFIQALGLPMFLVGQNVQALQTLASSPSLLSTFVDHNGMYDQARLMTLVQTLSGSSAPAPAALGSFPQLASQGIYGPSPGLGTPSFGQVQSAGFPLRNGFRSNNPDGNLHVSGYGPTTTEQDIINLFAPYVIVDEVVMKGNFAFVNTSDPENAQKAREALTGSYVGGMPVRINPAQRKPREVGLTPTSFGGSTSSSFGGATSTGFGGNAHSVLGSSFGSSLATQSVTGMSQPPVSSMPQSGPPSLMPSTPAAMLQTGAQPLAQGINVDAVRDDRGNPATKNLFVAGYGHGTTEQQIRDIFSKHVHVIGVVLKGSFTFVNTADRATACVARDALSGVLLNGGALRINFAKETGRLGTSFDLTYGPNTGPNARRGPPGPPPMSYYGRG